MINYALTDKSRIKTRLGIDLTVTSFDEVIDSIIAATTTRMEQMAGRRFLATTYTEELYDGSDAYGDAQSIIIVNNAPVLTLTKFEYKTGSNSSPTWVEFSEDDYDINERNGIIFMKLPRGRMNLRLSYQAGYLINFSDTTTFYSTTQHTLPYDLTEVCEEVVVRIFKRRDSDGKQSESFNASTITWTDKVFSPEHVTTINNYRRIVP
jgi:hypothetical protein